MALVEVKAIMGEPYKITASPENGLNYGLYDNKKINHFSVRVPPDLKYFGFHYKIDGEEFTNFYNPLESTVVCEFDSFNWLTYNNNQYERIWNIRK